MQLFTYTHKDLNENHFHPWFFFCLNKNVDLVEVDLKRTSSSLLFFYTWEHWNWDKTLVYVSCKMTETLCGNLYVTLESHPNTLFTHGTILSCYISKPCTCLLFYHHLNFFLHTDIILSQSQTHFPIPFPFFQLFHIKLLFFTPWLFILLWLYKSSYTSCP